MSISTSLSGGGGGSGGGAGTIAGSTGATDNRVLRSDGTGGTTLQTSGVALDDNGAFSLNPLRFTNTSGGGTTPESGYLVVNSTQASGTHDVDLPAVPALGFWCVVAITNAFTVSVNPGSASDVFYLGATPTTAGQSLTSNVPGSVLYLFYAKTNVWVTLLAGTWTPV